MSEPPAQRGNRPTMTELRAVAQPPTVLGRRNSEHWAGALYLRKGSIFLTRALLPTGISANGVTWLMIVIGVLGALVLMLPGWWPFLVCAVLIQLHIMVDCSDGEVARWRNQSGVAGVYIDRVGHYIVEPLLPICFGIHLDGGITHAAGWTMLGMLTAILVLGKKAIGDLVHVARTYFGWPKMSEDAEVAAPRAGGLRSVRSVLRFFPFFRAFGAIEYSLILFVLASVDAVLGLAGGSAEPEVLQWWMIIGVGLAAVTAGGYLLAILASNRLRRP